MDTELGRITHEYHWLDGVYYRRLLFGPAHWEQWGKDWTRSWRTVEALPNAA